MPNLCQAFQPEAWPDLLGPSSRRPGRIFSFCSTLGVGKRFRLNTQQKPPWAVRASPRSCPLGNSDALHRRQFRCAVVRIRRQPAGNPLDRRATDDLLTLRGAIILVRLHRHQPRLSEHLFLLLSLLSYHHAELSLEQTFPGVSIIWPVPDHVDVPDALVPQAVIDDFFIDLVGDDDDAGRGDDLRDGLKFRQGDRPPSDRRVNSGSGPSSGR